MFVTFQKDLKYLLNTLSAMKLGRSADANQNGVLKVAFHYNDVRFFWEMFHLIMMKSNKNIYNEYTNELFLIKIFGNASRDKLHFAQCMVCMDNMGGRSTNKNILLL